MRLPLTLTRFVHERFHQGVRRACGLSAGSRALMSSGMDLRKRGKRKEPETQSKKQRGRLGDPLNAIDAGSPGEIRISADSMVAISHLYNSSPSIQAARTILLGQLLGSGVVVRREGRDVNLTPVFARHLEDTWLPFARSVIDNFLQFGFVLVSLENEAPPPFANFTKGKQLASSSNMAPRGRAGTHASREAPTASESRQRAGHAIEDDAQMDARVNKSKGRGNLVPTVPDLGQYEVSFVHTGESNYTREYRVFSTNSDSVYRQDFSSEIFFRSQPDAAGNICSPVATVFQSASFISSLEELALQAEVVRARQLLVTQPAMRQGGNQNLDPSNLFFDSESRAVQASTTADEDSQQVQSLATTAKLMQVINRMQTTDDMGRERQAASGGVTHLPPPMPPTLFTCPEKQQVVPGVRPPEARSDLVDLMRTVNDHISAAMGVSQHGLKLASCTNPDWSHAYKCSFLTGSCLGGLRRRALHAQTLAIPQPLQPPQPHVQASSVPTR